MRKVHHPSGNTHVNLTLSVLDPLTQYVYDGLPITRRFGRFRENARKRRRATSPGILQIPQRYVRRPPVAPTRGYFLRRQLAPVAQKSDQIGTRRTAPFIHAEDMNENTQQTMWLLTVEHTPFGAQCQKNNAFTAMHPAEWVAYMRREYPLHDWVLINAVPTPTSSVVVSLNGLLM